MATEEPIERAVENELAIETERETESATAETERATETECRERDEASLKSTVNHWRRRAEEQVALSDFGTSLTWSPPYSDLPFLRVRSDFAAAIPYLWHVSYF
jgi:hypothetical protein